MIHITNKTNCCGCNACYNICPTNAIKMIDDEKGFWYPNIDKDKCINCGMCDKVCPILNNIKVNNNPVAYACYNKDENIRISSSSGGMFTLLATYVINKGGVVFGAAFNDDSVVEHICINNTDDLYKLRRSKYLQSNTKDTYKQAKKHLDNNMYVLYTGTPCQIEGLKKYLQKDYENLYTQDIICHGVPSPKVWKKYLKFKLGNCEKGMYNFRDKSTGWINYSVTFKSDKLEYKELMKNDIYMKAFLKNFCLRDSCYDCKFKKYNRVSDVTLADFWGIDAILPEMNDNKGTSLVILNSNKGRELFEGISADIVFKQVDMEKAIKGNTMMLKSVDCPKSREKFFKDLDNIDFDKLVKKCTPKPNYFYLALSKCKSIAYRILKSRK